HVYTAPSSPRAAPHRRSAAERDLRRARRGDGGRGRRSYPHAEAHPDEVAMIHASTRGRGRRLPLPRLLGLFLLMASSAYAQDVRWERVREPFSAQGLDVADGGMLYAAGSAGLLRLTPEDTWEVLYDDYVRSVAVLGAGDTLVV